MNRTELGITYTEVNLRFLGQYQDEETDLHYNWNRYYDAGIGRYVTSEPIGLDGGLNTYGYALQNPLVYYDEDGQIAIHIGRALLQCIKNPKKCRKNTCNALNAFMHSYCDPARSCKGGDSCEILKKKKSKLSRGIMLRKAVRACHGRKNDPNPKGHEKAIQQLRNRVNKCNRLLFNTDCCS